MFKKHLLGGKTRYLTVVFSIVLLIGGVKILIKPQEPDVLTGQVDFNRDIRPILNKSCTSCHGGVKQAGEVSFIYRDEVLGKGKSGRPTVIPGKPGASELIARVTSMDPDVRMPLHAPPLPPEQISLLRRWIKEGAQWEDYWAFVPPKPQALPEVKNKQWVRQPLDRFILAHLEKDSLAPSPEADRAALLRRVSFDLTGLPPTPEVLSAFLADSSEDAYEKQVDSLLASPAYGERWSAMWLDLARYGDSKGFENDWNRSGVWPYRDWVIEAFNRNVPYDQFVIKQVAGDLLPSPTFRDLIATSFHRQTLANDEGGSDDEEFRLAAVMDRVETTWLVLNGITMNCVQCHSHPYDPVSHTDYYKSLAFFNTSRDADIPFYDQYLKGDWPVLRVPKDKVQFPEAANIEKQIRNFRKEIVTFGRKKVSDDASWEMLPIKESVVNEVLGFERELKKLEKRFSRLPVNDQIERKYVANSIVAIKEDLMKVKKVQTPTAKLLLDDGMAELMGTVPIYSVFELTALADMPVITALRIEVPPEDVEKARHSPEKGFIIDNIEAWEIHPDGRSEKIVFRYFVPDSEADLEVNMARTLENSLVQKIFSPEDSIRRLTNSSGLMANPNLFRTRWTVGVPIKPLQLPTGTRIKVQLTHRQSIATTPAPVPRVRLLASSDSRWSIFAEIPGLVEEKIARLEKLERRIKEISTVPLPIMEEQPPYAQRQTRVFERGNFLNKVGDVLLPDVPVLFPDLPADKPHNRLTLAQWFFLPEQPLTARVAVNRYWEQLFGTGLVETLEDFGSAGEMPSHPALLDWLALYFQNDLHWDMKALLRELVTSATYRQHAKTTPALQEKDPRNRLLARGPQQRLTAEMVRDQALLASGLLNAEMGGPPVMPPQPEGVWNPAAQTTEQWVNATGSDRYRRAVYTYIKRSSVYPSFLAFDSSDRQLSLQRRIPTNTPLQALVTMNDPVYQEAAKALAKRMMTEISNEIPGDIPNQRINYGARSVLSRELTDLEHKTLRQFYNSFMDNADKKTSSHLNREQMALTAVANLLFNLDAALTR